MCPFLSRFRVISPALVSSEGSMDGAGHHRGASASAAAGAPGAGRGGEDDTMRLYAVFQDSFNKIKDGPSTGYPPGAAGDPSDPAAAFPPNPQFGQPPPQQENFSPEHPYFPFASSSGGGGAQNSGGRLPSAARVKADKDGAPEDPNSQQWYGDEFAPKLGGYPGPGGYFEGGAGPGGPADWQNYGAAAGAYSPSPSSQPQHYPPTSGVDSILYPPPPAQEFPPAGTPPVTAPAAFTSTSASGSGGPPRGVSNLDDAISVISHHVTPEGFPAAGHPGAPGLPPMSTVVTGDQPPPVSAPPHSTNGALLSAAGAAGAYPNDLTSSEYQLPNPSEASTSGEGPSGSGGARKRKSDTGGDLSDKPSSSSSAAKRGKRAKKDELEDDSMPPEVRMRLCDKRILLKLPGLAWQLECILVV